MKVLIEPKTKTEIYKNNIDGLIISLKDYAVQSEVYYTKEEIKKLREDNKDLEIFVNINKNFFNHEIEDLKQVLIYLDELNLNGLLFYDLAILKLKKELNLKTDLVWYGTYMVTNYKTCNYYYNKGVKYAILSKEITKEEIIEILNKSKIISMIEIISLPTVAFSKRKLITNYYKNLSKPSKEKLTVVEKLTQDKYELKEEPAGTGIISKKITNGTSVIKDLYDNNASYIIIKEYGLDIIDFNELLKDLKDYLKNNCNDSTFIEKYKILGDNTNFFYTETFHRVKKISR